MKLLVAFLISFLAMADLLSAPVLDHTVPSDAESALIKALSDSYASRTDIDISFSDYQSSQEAGGILLSVAVEYGGRTVRIEGFGQDEVAAISSLSSSLSSLLYYDSSLYPDSEYRLEYIFGRNYSMKRADGIRLGSRFSLLGADGRTHGVFVVSDHYTDYDVLKPLFLSDPLPGMELKKESGFDWSLDYGISFPIETHYASLSLGCTSIIYPIRPIVQAVYTYNNVNGSSFYGGIGISARASISSLFRASFTLFEEGSIGATASLLAGYSAGAFALRGSYSVYYEHRAAPHFVWHIGYLYTPDGKHSLSVGIGGDL